MRFKKKKQRLSETMGMNIETATEMLEDLFKQKDETQKQYDDLSAKQTSKIESLDMIGLRHKRRRIDEAITQIRDWYGLFVFEVLEEESRTLKWLTVVLIALTIVLTVFTGFLVSGIRIP